MPWEVKDEDVVRPVRLPSREQRIGKTIVTWFEGEPGKAIILTAGGSIDDRWLAYALVRDELATAGIDHAVYSFDDAVAHAIKKTCNFGLIRYRNSASLSRLSAWPDIMAKAKRLIQSGNVTLLRNGYNNIVGHVIGDHGEYTCEISRDDPASRAITQWTCECPWDQFAFQRTRQWKKYEGRPCAHVLAAYWKSLATPLDEDVPPGQEGRPPSDMPPGGTGPRIFSPVTQPQQGIMSPQQGIEQGYQPSLPVPGQSPTGEPMPMPAPSFPGAPPQSPMPMAPPAMMTPPLMAPPADVGIIPPQPMAMNPEQMQLPVSVPGGRPGPYPANPIQQPGTFSKIYKVGGANDQFIQGMKARLNEATLGQSEGREGAFDAGQWMEVPKNAMVEVRDQDQATGWVEIIYPLKGGAMSSYHVRCFVEPAKLSPMGGPSPFQNPRRTATQVQVHTPESLGMESSPSSVPVQSVAMIYDPKQDKLHLGSEDDVHHEDIRDHTGLRHGTSYSGYISYPTRTYTWYSRPPNVDQLHATLAGHTGYELKDSDQYENALSDEDIWQD